MLSIPTTAIMWFFLPFLRTLSLDSEMVGRKFLLMQSLCKMILLNLAPVLRARKV